MESLGVFAKYWQPGKVKTRLAAAIGPTDAARLHQVFVRTMLRRFDAFPCRKVLAVTPVEHLAKFTPLAGGNWTLRPQGDGDLGQRMARFMEEELTGGATRVVIVGSDSPSLPLRHVAEAFQRLRRVPVVLGPSRDGGYYLVGTSSRLGVPPIFRDMNWGTPTVWESTVRRLRAAGIDFSELPPWYDVDELADLRHLGDELATGTHSDLPLADLTPQVIEILDQVGQHE